MNKVMTINDYTREIINNRSNEKMLVKLADNFLCESFSVTKYTSETRVVDNHIQLIVENFIVDWFDISTCDDLKLYINKNGEKVATSMITFPTILKNFIDGYKKL